MEKWGIIVAETTRMSDWQLWARANFERL